MKEFDDLIGVIFKDKNYSFGLSILDKLIKSKKIKDNELLVSLEKVKLELIKIIETPSTVDSISITDLNTCMTNVNTRLCFLKILKKEDIEYPEIIIINKIGKYLRYPLYYLIISISKFLCFINKKKYK